jgi:hypothetical protein
MAFFGERDMKSIASLLPTLALVLLRLLSATVVHAGTVHRFVEDFETTQYQDAAQTTAWWNTQAGEIRLPPFALSVTGAYVTPHYSRDVAVAGDIAFVADVASGLHIFDVSDPSAPVHLANLADQISYDSDLTVVGDVLYIADGLNGLRAVDVTDPANPLTRGLHKTPGFARGVIIDGDYAYVADSGSIDETASFRIVDISNPSAPSLVGSYPLPDFAVYVDVSGDLAFVANGPGGLHIFDVSNPAQPNLIGALATPDYNREVDIAGSYLYMAVATHGLWVVDVSDPTTPVRVGGYNTSGYSVGVTVDGDYAYIADRANGLVAVDVSDPTSPTFLGEIDLIDESNKSAIKGNLLYVADGAGGLQIVEIAQTTGPLPAADLMTIDGANGIDVSGQHAYVADGASGLRVVDITSPTAPAIAGTYDTPGDATAVLVWGPHAYVADGASGLQLIDIRDPAAPASVSDYDTPGNALAVAVAGDFAFVADGASGVQVIDISVPPVLTLAGSYATPDDACGITLFGDVAFVAARDAGVRVLDITDPANPVFAGAYDSPGVARDVALEGDYAYIADGPEGLLIIGIADPANPVFVAAYDTPGDASDVMAIGDHVLVADGATGGLLVVDISDPASPQFIGSDDTPGALALDVWGEFAYVAGGTAGLRVLEVFQRTFDLGANEGRSTNIHTRTDDVRRVRLGTEQNDVVSWEVTADGGANWQGVAADATWVTLATTGDDVRWRSLHEYAAYNENPSASSLEMEWLYDFAAIDSIVDVPNDKGGWVNVFFTRSGHDFADEGAGAISNYEIYRRRPAQADSWELVETVPALEHDQYVVPAPTLGDSSDAVPPSVYYVSARTATPDMFFDSPPDSGHSVDNTLAVGILVFEVRWVDSGVAVEWGVGRADGLRGFHVYRSTSPDEGYVRINEEMIPAARRARYIDDTGERGRTYWYRVGAIDADGESLSPAQAVVIPRGVFSLQQNHPNPFNPSTEIRYEIPQAAAVTLEIFDVRGRRLRTLVSEQQAAGGYAATWNGKDDGGRKAASGIYFYRLRAGLLEKTLKMVLVE